MGSIVDVDKVETVVRSNVIFIRSCPFLDVSVNVFENEDGTTHSNVVSFTKIAETVASPNTHFVLSLDRKSVPVFERSCQSFWNIRRY